MNRILEKIKKRIDEIQSDCLDDHYNFKNSHNEGVFEGLSKLESYIESLETDIDMKEWKDAQCKTALEAIIDEKVDNANKVEPKFKVGDWFVNDITKDIYRIKSIINGYCTLEDLKGNIIYPCLPPYEIESHLWTIQDAKDGDVLANDNSIFIFQEEYIAEKPIAYCGLMNGLFIEGENACWTNKKCNPATKEQREQLKKAMADAGYTFDFENKELLKIEQKPAKKP